MDSHPGDSGSRIMRIDWVQLGVGLVLNAAAGWAGYRLGRLAPSGLAAVTPRGLVHLRCRRLAMGNLLSALCAQHRHLVALSYQPEPSREGRQTLAARRAVSQVRTRSWPPRVGRLCLALLHLISPQTNAILAAYVGALATMTGDSWATDVGMLSARSPWLITSGRRVLRRNARRRFGPRYRGHRRRSLAGRFCDSAVCRHRSRLDRSPWDRGWLWLPFAAAIGSLVGCFVDSLLGAAAQVMFYCERCQQESEERVHTCGKEAKQQRGWTWLTNNGVNWLSSVVGAAVTMQVFLWVAQLSTRW